MEVSWKYNTKEQQLQQANYLMIQVQNEASLFRKLLIDEDCISTRRFWLQYKSQLPYLFSLTKKLLNIQASTGKFFSIYGIICNVKNKSMTDKIIFI